MAVKVELLNTEVETVDDATSIRVDDGGHLILQRQTSAGAYRPVAAYATGTWRSAHVVDASK